MDYHDYDEDEPSCYTLPMLLIMAAVVAMVWVRGALLKLRSGLSLLANGFAVGGASGRHS